jgi:diamine N-acetyltransferase
MEKVKLRLAKPDDYVSLCQLFDEVDSLHRDQLPAIFQKPAGPVRDKDYLLGLITDSNVLLLVAEYDGKLVGLAHVFVKETPEIPVFVHRRYAIIDSIVVSKQAQRQGIGSLLAEKVHAWAKAEGAQSIELNVYDFNRAAIDFY